MFLFSFSARLSGCKIVLIFKHVKDPVMILSLFENDTSAYIQQSLSAWPFHKMGPWFYSTK